MQIEEVKSCRICGNNKLVSVLDLGMQAIASRFPKADEQDPMEAPLVLVKCDDSVDKNNCGLVQLKHRVASEELYQHDYGYRSGLNNTMTTHLQNLVKDVENRISLKEGDVVLDIGSNDATLLKSYATNGIQKIGIDPTGAQFKSFYTSDIKLIPDYFNFKNYQLASDKKAKAITSIAMFYDLPAPVEFVRDIKKSLDENGIWVFEQSYMPFMLDTKSFDTVCHEHLEYYCLKQIKWMFDREGMKIVDVEFNSCNGGSFRVTASHAHSTFVPNYAKINSILKDEQEKKYDTLKPYIEFEKSIQDTKEKLLSFLTTEKSKGKSIYIYGASTKGNTLLQHFNIDKSIVTAAAERNTEKYGRRTPKTNIPIISEAEARAAKPDYFVVLPWHFKEEFLQREKDYLNSGGSFVFPLPKFEVVTAETRHG